MTSYLIIGGVPKSATTSVYQYLRDHPEVCASSIKETRFFLDLEYPVPSVHRYSAGAATYLRFFQHCRDEQLRVESSPFYLYSTGTAARIKATLPNARMMFVLRDPVSRLQSSYHYERQHGELSNYTFKEYIAHQAQISKSPPHLGNAIQLTMGCYAEYLRRYLEVFGPDRVLVIFFEELAANPAGAMRKVAEFCHIAPQFYDQYRFTAFNQTVSYHNSVFAHSAAGLQRLRLSVTRYSMQFPSIHAGLRRIYRDVARALRPLVSHEVEVLGIDPATLKWLGEYYRADCRALAELLGRPVPWADSLSKL